MATPPRDERPRAHARSFRRTYLIRPSNVRRGAAFAAAAVLAAVGPEDWQISQDVAEAASALLTRAVAECGEVATEMRIEVRLTRPLQVEVASDSGWTATETVRRRAPGPVRPTDPTPA